MVTLNNIADLFTNLPESKKELVELFIKELSENEKNKKLRLEVESRRDEIKKGKKISNKEFWNEI
jgi:hypothetical protein